MQTKKFPLFFFLLITLSILITIPQYIEPVSAEDYIVFEIANTSANINLTYVWNNYLYVYNDTRILKYDLSNQSLADTHNLGSTTVITEMIGHGDLLYAFITEVAMDKVLCFNLMEFEEMDRLETTSLGGTWDGYIENIAYMNVSGTDYWAYTRIQGSQLQEKPHNRLTITGWNYPYPQYPRFVGMAWGSHGTNVDGVHIEGWLWNGTGLEMCWEDVSIPQHRGVTGYIEFDTTPTALSGGEHYSSLIYYRRWGYNVNSFTDIDARFVDGQDGDWIATYVTKDQVGLHSLGTHFDDDAQWMPDLPETDKTYYDYDAVKHSYWWDDAIKDEVTLISFWAERYREVISGNNILIELSKDADWDAPNPVGKFSAIETLDHYGYEAIYFAYVQDLNQTPIAYLFYAGNLIEVGELPDTYDPNDTMLFANYVGEWDDYTENSLVAVWTESGETSLYVCPQLIEGIWLRYGEEESIVAQLYKCKPSTVAEDNFRIATRWMVDNANYDRIPYETISVYEDGAWYVDMQTNGYGVAEYVYSPSSYPRTLSHYMNRTGYNDFWLNVTLFSYDPFYANSTVTEEPILTLGFSDNRETENLRVYLTAYRYTGELFTDEWFGYSPIVYVDGEIYSGGLLENTITLGLMDLDTNGQVQFILSYTQPYAYILKHYFRTPDQYGATGNFTENTQVEFSYDSSTGNITEGEYVSIPDTPTQPTHFEDDTINPTTIEQFAVVWTGNVGFLIALGFITAITVGFAKISPESAVFGVITLVGLTLGFLGYTGLLPFPIFIVVLLVIVLGITVIFTGLFTGGKNKEKG